MLNEILAGPILRRLTNKQLVLWWISPAICRGEFVCYLDYKPVLQVPLHSDVLSSHQIGERAFVHTIETGIASIDLKFGLCLFSVFAHGVFTVS